MHSGSEEEMIENILPGVMDASLKRTCSHYKTNYSKLRIAFE